MKKIQNLSLLCPTFNIKSNHNWFLWEENTDFCFTLNTLFTENHAVIYISTDKIK